MSGKIVIYSPNEGIRESLKLMLTDFYDLILTDSFEQSEEILSTTKAHLFIIDLTEEENFIKIIKQMEFQRLCAKVIIILGRKNLSKKQNFSFPKNCFLLNLPLRSDEILQLCQ